MACNYLVANIDLPDQKVGNKNHLNDLFESELKKERVNLPKSLQPK
jgi:hypothetical protein